MIRLLRNLRVGNDRLDDKLGEIEKNREEVIEAVKEHEEATQRLEKLVLENGFHVLLAAVVGIKHK